MCPTGSALHSPSSQAADAAHHVTEVRPRRGWQLIDFGELWRARDLIWMFTVRDVKVRYKQTFFGYAWAVVVPVIQVLVLSVFFGMLLGVGGKVDEAAGRAVPYPLFALTGQIVWNFFNTIVSGASTSLQANAGIIRKIYVPRLSLPLSSLGKPTVDVLVVFLLMVGLTVFYAVGTDYEVALTWRLLLSPLPLLGVIVPALGVGLIMSALTVNYRDLSYVLPFVISMLFYVTPVIYPVEILPEGFEWLIYLNPVAGFVQASRGLVMDMPVDWLGVLISVGLSAGLLVYGLFYFAKVEREFADVA